MLNSYLLRTSNIKKYFAFYVNYMENLQTMKQALLHHTVNIQIYCTYKVRNWLDFIAKVIQKIEIEIFYVFI